MISCSCTDVTSAYSQNCSREFIFFKTTKTPLWNFVKLSHEKSFQPFLSAGTDGLMARRAPRPLDGTCLVRCIKRSRVPPPRWDYSSGSVFRRRQIREGWGAEDGQREGLHRHRNRPVCSEKRQKEVTAEVVGLIWSRSCWIGSRLLVGGAADGRRTTWTERRGWNR